MQPDCARTGRSKGARQEAEPLRKRPPVALVPQPAKQEVEYEDRQSESLKVSVEEINAFCFQTLGSSNEYSRSVRRGQEDDLPAPSRRKHGASPDQRTGHHRRRPVLNRQQSQDGIRQARPESVRRPAGFGGHPERYQTNPRCRPSPGAVHRSGPRQSGGYTRRGRQVSEWSETAQLHPRSWRRNRGSQRQEEPAGRLGNRRPRLHRQDDPARSDRQRVLLLPGGSQTRRDDLRERPRRGRYGERTVLL